MRPERLIFVVSSDSIGGAEQHALLLAGRLKSRFHISVVCNGGLLAARFSELSLPVKTIPLRDNCDILGLSRLWRVFHRKKPDLGHLHMNRATHLGSLAARIAGIPSLATMQSFTKGLYARYADLITVCSPGMTAYYADLGIDSHRIRLVHNPMNPEEFRPERLGTIDLRKELGLGPDTVLAIYSGRLHPMKGLRELPEFASQAAHDAPELHFILAGEGEEHLLLQREILRRSLRNMHLLGFRRDIKACVAGSDFMILPSRSEGIPLALTEGLYLEKPFVAYGVNDVPVLAETGGGIIIPPGDQAGFYQAVLSLTRDRGRRLAMGSDGHRIIEKRFRIEQCLDDMEKIYTELVNVYR
ncbi:MAG: glycosyltransferase [Candidatus Wallbacteria bacterium]|nr:glycosyltransferase [Candidatus Wallbacteria bacterium]